jgi:SPOR domain
LAGTRISLLLAATLAVVSTSASHASLSERDRPELSWVIQVGALETEAQAEERLRTARQYAQPLLDNAREYIETVDKGTKRLYRARFAVDFDTVKPVCATLKKANVSCIAISPTLPTNATPVVVTPASAPPGQPPSVSPKVRANPPPHRAKPPQPKSIWQAIKDSVKQ